MQQGVLFLPKEEGGHGLVQLKSRIAAFRLQFLQRFLYGSLENGWRVVACSILHSVIGVGLDKSLFLMDPLKLNVSKLPVFYENLFKVWNLFDLRRNEMTPSIHWLLEEPLINGARFDLTKDNSSFHGLNALLLNSKIFTLGLLIRIAGVDFKNTEEVASCLKIKSMRTVERMLMSWKSLVNDEEKRLLLDTNGIIDAPILQDCFPLFTLLPKLEGCKGPFLDGEKCLCLDFLTATGKAFL